MNFPDKIKEEYKKRGESISKTLQQRSKIFSENHKKSISEAIKRYYDKIGRKSKRRILMPYKSLNASGKKIKVFKDSEEHTVYECDKQWYLENGWILGRNPNNKKSIAKTETARNASSGKGKLIVHNKFQKCVKRINPNELEKYILNGWERGYLNKKV